MIIIGSLWVVLGLLMFIHLFEGFKLGGAQLGDREAVSCQLRSKECDRKLAFKVTFNSLLNVTASES